MSIILGIDPGTTTVGFAVIRVQGQNREVLDAGIIHTTPKIALVDKLREIDHDVRELVATYHVERAGIETLIFATNQTTGIAVAESRGVILLALASSGVEIHEFSPLEVKKGICGNGRATKVQVQNAVKMLYHLKELPKPDDCADAMAIAYVTGLIKSTIKGGSR